MAKHKISGFITYERSRHTDKVEISFYTFRPDPKHWPDMVVVSDHVIEVEVPDDFDPRADLIKGLREQEKKARADFERLCTDIHARISKLQALELAPGVSS